MSCASALSGWCSSRSGRSRTSPRIWASIRSRCATGCGRPRPIAVVGVTAEERRARRAEEAAQGELRAASRERDLEGRLRRFRDGARPDPATVTRYIEKRRDAFGVEPICRVLGVPVSTHYARRSRKPSARELADQELLVEIEAAERPPPRVRGPEDVEGAEAARRRGRPDRVARVMRQHGLEGKLRGSKKRTTIRTRPRPSGPAICCSATSRRRGRTRSGSPTSPTSAPGTGSSISPSSSTATAA